ncbi:MAG: FecR domain-containing protein, partial [Planctomycetota bacterium]
MSETALNDTDLLISLYLDGDIEAQDFRRLDAWLKEDRAHVTYFVDRVADHCRTSELVSSEFNLPFLAPESESIFRDASSAEADLPQIQYSAPGVMTKQKYAGALSYVLRHAFTPKHAAALAAAAAVLLACVLAVLLLTGPGQGPELAQTRQEPDENPYAVPAAQPAPAVATLTAQQRDTDWANEILSPGTRLRAGERLTLIRGVAEITTNRGAVAVIEAPASIEFLDHDNAIRLHSGKLVGICETDLSKGFLVQTPHMAITDLSTEFCVDVSDNNTSTVHVLQGEVAVESARALRDEEPLHLKTGESASASARRPRARTTPQTPEDLGRFQNVSIQSITLRGTGAGLGMGSFDRNWEVVEANCRTLNRPERVEVFDHKFYKLPN